MENFKLFESLKNISEKTQTIPTTTPQDPNFDTFINYVCTRDPTIDEPNVYNNLPYLPLWWQNTTTNEFWLCPDNTAAEMIWGKLLTNNNLTSELTSLGIIIPSARSYTTPTLGFSTLRTPSIFSDTLVIATISQSSVLLGSATVDAIVDSGIVGKSGLSGAVATQINTLTFLVPINTAYELTQATTGIGASNSIISINEISI